MNTPTRDDSSPEVHMARNSVSPASDASLPVDQRPTPSSGSSSRAETPENAPVDAFRAVSKPKGPSQQNVKYKRKHPPTKSEWIDKPSM